MWKSTVDRIKAEIIIPQLKISWSVITGNLESIVSLPENCEWVGKNEINMGFQNKNAEKINYEITDLDFSEYCDEKSSGILQTLYFGQNRFRILYFTIQNTPVIFIKYEMLINTPFPDGTKFIPFYFNLSKTINKIELNYLSTSKRDLSFLKADEEYSLILYMENGINIDINQNNVKGFKTVLIHGEEQPINIQKSIIKLPRMYIGSLKNFTNNDIQTWHYKNIGSLKKYEKWLYEKSKCKKIHY